MGKEELPRILPEFFRPLFWSYNFETIDPLEQKKLVIIDTINYGDLKHWRWLKENYGEEVIREVLENIPATELRPRAGRLAELLFNFHLNYAPRGAHR